MTQHSGGCHCGAVRYIFTAPSEMSMTSCNCSICAASAYQHIFVPQGNVEITGAENLTTYTFGSGQAKHLFCKVCGVKPLYIPKSHPEDYSINYRCITPGTMTISKVIEFDGQNWEKNIAALRDKT